MKTLCSLGFALLITVGAGCADKAKTDAGKKMDDCACCAPAKDGKMAPATQPTTKPAAAHQH